MGKRYVEQSSGYADRLQRSREFDIPSPKGPETHARIFIFRWPGDEIEGWLRSGPITNWRRNASYLIELVGDQAAGKHGAQIEIFGNKQLHTIIRQHELVGKLLRIRYIGRQLVHNCNLRRKVYRIWRIEGLGVLAPENIHEQEGSGGAVENLDETD